MSLTERRSTTFPAQRVRMMLSCRLYLLSKNHAYKNVEAQISEKYEQIKNMPSLRLDKIKIILAKIRRFYVLRS